MSFSLTDALLCRTPFNPVAIFLVTHPFMMLLHKKQKEETLGSKIPPGVQWPYWSMVLQNIVMNGAGQKGGKAAVRIAP
jgi:hypothetical protein